MKPIFFYEDYRGYLRDWLSNQPKKGRGVRKLWGERLRVGPSVLSQILSGKRGLSLDQSHEFKKYLGLSELEAEYFSLLVLFDRAATEKLKSHLKVKLKKIRQESLDIAKNLEQKGRITEEQKAIFYSNWIYSAVTLASSLSKFQTPEQISKKLKIDINRIRQVLSNLCQTGLVTEDAGKFKSNSKRIFLDKSSPLMTKHHSNWRIKALQQAEELTDEDLMFTAPLTISRSDFMKIRQEIFTLIKNVSETVKKTEPEDLAVFQIDFFWIK